ncbi:MAG: 50S ribosomal protein L18 [Nanoarchaeota archaeon]
MERNRKSNVDYRRRRRLLTGKKPRLVIRASLNHMIAQVITYDPDGDRVIAAANSKELRALGWEHSMGNIPSAYLVGLMLGLRLKGKEKELIPDLGGKGSVKGTRMYATIKGVVDAGILVPHDKEVFPPAERLSGKHIAAHGEKNPDTFSRKPSTITADFDKIKKMIMEGSHAKGKD